MATPPTITPPGSEITAKLSDDLKAALKQKMEGAGLFESEDDRPHHHVDGKPSIVTAAASGLVNFLLMFGMCCAYGIIMFSDDHNRVHVPLAIKMNLSAALVIGLLCAFFSKMPVAIGGPDINPAVFLGLFVEAMAPAIADDLGLDYPETSNRRLGSSSFGGRELASSSATFCMGAHLQDHQEACAKYHDELTATTIFAAAVSTFLLGTVFVTLGSLKLTRYMAYLPTTIVEAFLACVGYKVFQYAVKQCEYDPLQFVPAGIIGIGLYFMKAKHIGNPAIVMPLGFLLPLLLFHLGIFTVGSTVNEARNKDWMFTEIENVDFWEIWTQSIGKPANINIQAWTKTLPDLAIMLIVVCLDCVLKVVATDSKIPVHVDPDYEVRMHGINNLINTWSGSAVGYMQLKFNVINYGITRNVLDRRASIIYALLCGICYFGTLEPFNFLPRFFIGSLLFFAGSGFVAENLWGSRGTTSIWEWGEILVIVVAFVLTEQLVIAVLIGGLITFVIFIAKYAKISVIDGPLLQGGECRIVERMGPLMTRNIRYLLDNWLLVVKLKGYIFFASANTLTNHVGNYIMQQEELDVPNYRRLKYVVFDCSLLDGMDASAAKAMKRLVNKAGRASVRVLWTHLTPTLASELRMRGLLTASSKDVFTDVDEVVMQVENSAKSYLHGIEEKWVSLHPAFERFAGMTRAQFRFEPFTQILLSPMYRIGCPWRYCSTIQLHGHSTLLFSPGDNNGFLYLVHSGAVALFRELPQPGEDWDSPVAVYRQGWFLNRETLMRAPSRYYGVAIEDGEILCWSSEQWWRMACEMPLMTSEILKAVMKQQARDSDSYDEHAHSMMGFSDSMREMVHDEIGRKESGLSRNLSGQPTVLPLPEEIQVRLNAIETAQCLEKLGFYSNASTAAAATTSGENAPQEERVRPELPAKLKADIATAFNTYSRKSGSIAAGEVPSALMYAGLFHCPEVYDPDRKPQEPMTEEEFVRICHAALMAAFTPMQRQVVRTLFGMPSGDKQSGESTVPLTLTAAGLQRALRKAVPGITPEMADAFFVAWRGSDLSIPLDIQAFTGIMSLLVRLHEPYYDLMQGCRAVIGADRVCVQLELHFSRLVQVKELYGGPAISAEEAEEMLWSSDWRIGGGGDGKVLGWPEMVSAITATLRRNAGALPATCFDPSGDHMELMSLSSGPSSVELSKGLGTTHARSRMAVGLAADTPHAATGGAVELNLPMAPARESIKDKAKKVETWWAKTVKEFNGKTCLTRGAVVSLVAMSMLALVLEPMLSGEEDEQSSSEEQVWQIIEICITAWLAIEFLARLVVVGWQGLKASGHTQITLLLDLLATIPLALDGIAELLKDGAEDSRIQEMAHDGVKDTASLLRVLRLARIHVFSANTTLAAPVATMMVVVWGIYVKHGFTESK